MGLTISKSHFRKGCLVSAKSVTSLAGYKTKEKENIAQSKSTLAILSLFAFVSQNMLYINGEPTCKAEETELAFWLAAHLPLLQGKCSLGSFQRKNIFLLHFNMFLKLLFE